MQVDVEPRELGRARSERGEVVLRERGTPTSPVLELRVNGVFVMETAEVGSERAMARTALSQCDRPHDVLVGGLGLGFTTAEVLSDDRVRRVWVAELEAPLVAWFRDGTVPHGPALLADSRLSVQVADVREVVLTSPPGSFDLVLLDVDNGPGQLVHDVNERLYDAAFLALVRDVLRPGGSVVVWSAERSAALGETLTAVYGDAAELPHDVDLQGRAERYWLYLARRPHRTEPHHTEPHRTESDRAEPHNPEENR